MAIFGLVMVGLGIAAGGVQGRNALIVGVPVLLVSLTRNGRENRLEERRRAIARLPEARYCGLSLLRTHRGQLFVELLQNGAAPAILAPLLSDGGAEHWHEGQEAPKHRAYEQKYGSDCAKYPDHQALRHRRRGRIPASVSRVSRQARVGACGSRTRRPIGFREWDSPHHPADRRRGVAVSGAPISSSWWAARPA
jgi:hypothetical protein